MAARLSKWVRVLDRKRTGITHVDLDKCIGVQRKDDTFHVKPENSAIWLEIHPDEIPILERYTELGDHPRGPHREDSPDSE